MPSSRAKLSLTYKEAMRKAKAGYRVRCPAYMQKGWTIGWFNDGKYFGCINPITGSNYGFVPQDRDLNGKWEVVS